MFRKHMPRKENLPEPTAPLASPRALALAPSTRPGAHRSSVPLLPPLASTRSPQGLFSCVGEKEKPGGNLRPERGNRTPRTEWGVSVRLPFRDVQHPSAALPSAP